MDANVLLLDDEQQIKLTRFESNDISYLILYHPNSLFSHFIDNGQNIYVIVLRDVLQQSV